MDFFAAYPSSESQPRGLTTEEVNDPYQVLDDFFDYATLVERRQMLWQWFESTVTDAFSTRLDSRERGWIVSSYTDVQKLIEAAYLILQINKARTMKKRPTMVLFIPNTYTMAPQLETYNNQSLQEVIKLMISATELEKVFLYGASEQQVCAKTIFLKSPVIHHTLPGYDFLVLAADSEKRKLPELNDLLDNAIRKWRSATVYILPVTQFNDWLLHGHPFAWKIYHQAIRCFDAGKIPLVAPRPYDEKAVNRQLEKMLRQHLNHATEFMQGAELFRVRKSHLLAAFHLHQACEQLYSGIIHYVTGLRIGTHNLMKLYRHSRSLLAGLVEIFPMHTEKEKRLFQLLQGAYIDARYTENYTITYSELAVLRERITQIMTLCQSLPSSITTTF